MTFRTNVMPRRFGAGKPRFALPAEGQARVKYDADRDRWVVEQGGQTFERPGDMSGQWEKK